MSQNFRCLPAGFTVGFGRADMSPSIPVMMGNHVYADTLRDPLYASCVAVSDGENAAILLHMDMKDMPREFFLGATEEIEKRTGIPASNVILNATHTHNCPHTFSREDPECVNWRRKGQLAAAEAAEAALKDLAPARIFISRGDTTGMNFTRRYRMADGSYKSICSLNPCTEYDSHETFADPEIRIIRMAREGKKDIVLVNWQGHCAHSQGMFKTSITADIIEILRNHIEGELGYHFTYHNGGSGNLVFRSSMKLHKYPNHLIMAENLAKLIEKELDRAEEVKSGKVRVRTTMLTGRVQQDGEEKRAHALEWARAPKEEREEILEKYGFTSMYEAIATNTRATMEEFTPIPLTAISFGDIAFATTPFESFDVNARQVREASPYKMTFSCAYSNGAMGYMPNKEAFPHGEYEVYVSRFECGTAENCVAELAKMLQENKKEDEASSTIA